METRTRRVLTYTATLLGTPVVAIVFFSADQPVYGMLIGGVIMTWSSWTLLRGEWRSSDRDLLRSKLIVVSIATLLLSICAVGISVCLVVMKLMGS